MTTDDVNRDVAETFWEELYGKKEQVWSGNPNAVLVREITGITPGVALDLGCGEGADAIWLAQHGWTLIKHVALGVEKCIEHDALVTIEGHLGPSTISHYLPPCR